MQMDWRLPKEHEHEKLFDSLKSQLNLFLDENGLWHCGGRLANADIPYSTKYPVLLPRSHSLTPLIINDAHKHVLHNGVRETLTEIRRRFWIVKGRTLVRAIIHLCITCRRFEGAPFLMPPPPPLPVSRVKEDPAFSFTGVDCAGPLMIRTEGPNKTGKAWICLFTCFVTRAVHLDIVLGAQRHSLGAWRGLLLGGDCLKDSYLIMAKHLRQPQNSWNLCSRTKHWQKEDASGPLTLNEPHGGVEPLSAWYNPLSCV